MKRASPLATSAAATTLPSTGHNVVPCFSTKARKAWLGQRLAQIGFQRADDVDGVPARTARAVHNAKSRSTPDSRTVETTARVMYSSTASILSSYEYVNYLLAVQVLVRIPLGPEIDGIQQPLF